MKVFTNKSIFNKIIIVLIIVILLSFIIPITTAQASLGGMLISPITEFFGFLGDCVLAIIQSTLESTVNFLEAYESIANGGAMGLDKMFNNSYDVLNINFIKTKEDSTLSGIIAQWYVAIRLISIIGLLSVLIYIGIRMVTSSTSQDKAKYKSMILDCLVAFCLVFFLHYIMMFILTLTEKLTNIFNVADGESFNITAFVRGKFGVFDSSGGSSFAEEVSYLFMYIVLVALTVVFAIKYLKRLLNMAFLTMIAPLVALTYPIDKVGDGKAQAFNKWFKEYTFNALIQPFHLLIYVVLVGAGSELIVKGNYLYGIVAVAFIIPAEKLIRKLFDYESGGLGTFSAAGAVATGLGLQQLYSKYKSGSGSRWRQKPI